MVVEGWLVLAGVALVVVTTVGVSVSSEIGEMVLESSVGFIQIIIFQIL